MPTLAVKPFQLIFFKLIFVIFERKTLFLMLKWSGLLWPLISRVRLGRDIEEGSWSWWWD